MQKTPYTLQFWLLSFSSVLFFSSFTMIIPELPAILDGMGKGELKGLIISLFTVTALLSRPFSGKLADTVGRKPVIVFGAIVCFACGFMYPFANTVWLFFLIRFIHGMSTGFTLTGTASYVADIAPPHLRGEAIGIHGLCANIGAAFGPALGSTLALHFSTDVMFYTSSVSAILSLLILTGLKETLPKAQQQKFQLEQMNLKWEEIFEPRIIMPFTIMVLVIFSFGVILTIIPDLSAHLGIQNKGIFFTYMTGASISIRFFAGRASDRYGRANILRVSSLFLTIAMFFIGVAESYVQLMACAVLFGLAHGTGAPTIFAWAIDLSIEKYRGRAMATLYIALELGVGLGAFISGMIYNNEIPQLKYAFWFSASLSLLAFFFLATHLQLEKKMKAYFQQLSVNAEND